MWPCNFSLFIFGLCEQIALIFCTSGEHPILRCRLSAPFTALTLKDLSFYRTIDTR